MPSLVVLDTELCSSRLYCFLYEHYFVACSGKAWVLCTLARMVEWQEWHLVCLSMESVTVCLLWNYSANAVALRPSCAYIECADGSVTISPSQSCVQDNTALSCSSADGHPGSPNYSWTRLDNGNTPPPGPSYTVSGIGFHHLRCSANYTHQYCPEYYAECHADINLETFSQYLCIEVKLCYFLLSYLLEGVDNVAFNGGCWGPKEDCWC